MEWAAQMKPFFPFLLPQKKEEKKRIAFICELTNKCIITVSYPDWEIEVDLIKLMKLNLFNGINEDKSNSMSRKDRPQASQLFHLHQSSLPNGKID